MKIAVIESLSSCHMFSPLGMSSAIAVSEARDERTRRILVLLPATREHKPPGFNILSCMVAFVDTGTLFDPPTWCIARDCRNFEQIDHKSQRASIKATHQSIDLRAGSRVDGHLAAHLTGEIAHYTEEVLLESEDFQLSKASRGC